MRVLPPPNQPPLISTKFLARYLPWLPPAITLALILFLHIDVPYHDQWDLLPLLDASYQHRVTLHDLLQPHNGHVLLLPQSIMLLLARLTHWNTLAEVLLGFGCMLINWRLLQSIGVRILNRPLRHTEQLLISLVIFSLAQAQNWLWGWQLQIPLALLFLLLGFFSLITVRNDTLALLGALICGVAASLSFAGSLPYWLAVIPLVWQRRNTLLIPWLLASSLIILIYISLIYTPTSGDHNPFPPLSDALRHTRNVLAILGNLGARYNLNSATTIGAMLLGIVMQRYFTLPTTQRNITLSLTLFSVGTALLVSFSRAGMGDEQMLATRYGTLTLPLWLTGILLLIDASQPRKKWEKYSVLIVLALGISANSLYSMQDWQLMHKRLLRGTEALTHINSDEGKRALPVINPRKDQAQALHEVQLLQQYLLSFYRDR